MSTALDSGGRVSRQEAADFDALISELDDLIRRHDSSEPVDETCRTSPECVPLLEEVVDVAAAGLKKFPRNGELLRRRAYALCRMSPEDRALLTEAQDDLQDALQFEPTNLRLALDLMGELFAFDGLEDKEVATVADALAEQAEQLMLEARALQIRALLFADESGKAAELAEAWQRLFPNSRELQEAVAEFEYELIPQR